MLCFQGTFFKNFRSALRARIKFVKRVILIGFCTKKALKMSLLGHFNLWTKKHSSSFALACLMGVNHYSVGLENRFLKQKRASNALFSGCYIEKKNRLALRARMIFFPSNLGPPSEILDPPLIRVLES